MRYRNEYTLLKRKMPTGRTVYYYAVYDELTGKRIYRSTGEKTKALAEKYVRELAENGKLGVRDRCMVRFRDYTRDFFIPGRCPIEKSNRERGKSITKATMSVRRTSLTEHILPYLGNRAVSGLTPQVIDRWIVELPEKDKISRSTANLQLITLRVILDQAVRDGIIAENPCAKVENLGNDTKVRNSFSLKEVTAILGKEENWPNPMVRTICLVAALTGMRLGEIRALKPECVTPEAILVKYSYSNIDGLKCPKNGLERLAPIPDGLYEKIMKWNWGDGGYIFRMYKPDKPLSAAWIEKELRTRMERLGIKGKTFHSFRAFFNTQMLSANVNGETLRKVMGHANEQMTLRYLHTDSAEFPVFRKAQEGIIGEILA